MELPALNFPHFEPTLEREGDILFIRDLIRRKRLVLTPEEWVRQHVLHYMIEHLGYPPSLIAVESGLKVNQLPKRADILAYKGTQPGLLVECKAPYIKMNEKAFHQACRYNLTLKVPFLLITNGLDHWAAKVNTDKGDVSFLDHIPTFEELP